MTASDPRATDPRPVGPQPIDFDAALAAATGDGVAQALDGGDDLNANLVLLGPDGRIGAHMNDSVDVLVIAVRGTLTADVDGVESDLHAPGALLIPKGTSRALRARGGPAAYVTVHRRRGGLGIGAPTRRVLSEER